MNARRWAALQRHLLHAQENIPLYRDLWRRHGVDVRELRSPGDLARLPLLTREALRAAGTDARLDPRHAGGALQSLTTSGSSGEPLQLLIDAVSRRRRQWRFLRALAACGYRPMDRLMVISSRPSASLRKVSPLASFCGWHYVDLYEGVEQMARDFLRLRPRLLYGPQNALMLLAGAISRTEARGLQLRAVVSTSEPLSMAATRRLREVFGCEVADFYGLTECGLVAWRPPGRRRYQLAEADLHLEYLPLELGTQSELVITDLAGGSMPLYRYCTGDLVQREPAAQGASVVAFMGKQLDAICLPDGARIAPYRIDGALSDIAGLERYRVVQQTDFALQVEIEARGVEATTVAKAALEQLCGGQLRVTVAAGCRPVEGLRHKARPIVSYASSGA